MRHLGPTPKTLPTAQEVALRPDLVKQMLTTAHGRVYEDEVEHALYIGLTPDGTPRVYHTWGKELTLLEVAQLLEDIATMAREQAK